MTSGLLSWLNPNGRSDASAILSGGTRVIAARSYPLCHCRVERKRDRIRRVKWQITLVILATLSASIALADDFKTINGKEYKNATVSHIEADGIVLKTKSGISKVYFVELPKEVQKRFGYDTDKIEAEKAAEEKRVEEQKAAQRQRMEKGRKSESKVVSIVSVTREIREEPSSTRSMTLTPRDLSFIRIVGDFTPDIMTFSDPAEAADVLAKFVEWDETAQRNNAEPFRKKINDNCTFEFSGGQASRLECHGKTPYVTFSGEFFQFDIDKFNELLKQLPEVKAELESKIAKAQKEEVLFK